MFDFQNIVPEGRMTLDKYLVVNRVQTLTDEEKTLASANLGVSQYTLPPASYSFLGGVIAGAGLTIETNGRLHVRWEDIPAATNTDRGGVMIQDGLLVGERGEVMVDWAAMPYADGDNTGGVRLGDGLVTDEITGKTCVSLKEIPSDQWYHVAGSISGAIAGDDLTTNADGKLSINWEAELPMSSTSACGAVPKINEYHVGIDTPPIFLIANPGAGAWSLGTEGLSYYDGVISVDWAAMENKATVLFSGTVACSGLTPGAYSQAERIKLETVDGGLAHSLLFDMVPYCGLPYKWDASTVYGTYGGQVQETGFSLATYKSLHVSRPNMSLTDAGRGLGINFLETPSGIISDWLSYNGSVVAIYFDGFSPKICIGVHIGSVNAFNYPWIEDENNFTASENAMGVILRPHFATGSTNPDYHELVFYQYRIPTRDYIESKITVNVPSANNPYILGMTFGVDNRVTYFIKHCDNGYQQYNSHFGAGNWSKGISYFMTCPLSPFVSVTCCNHKTVASPYTDIALLRKVYIGTDKPWLPLLNQ